MLSMIQTFARRSRGFAAMVLVAGGALIACAPSALAQPRVAVYNLPLAGNNVTPFNIPANGFYVAMTTPLVSVSSPDTLLAVRASAVQIIQNDDAGDDASGAAPAGIARGSAVRYVSTAAGLFDAQITGFQNVNSGPYALTSAVITVGGTADFQEVEPNGTPATATAISMPLMGAMVGVGSLTPGDIDYYSITVSAGDVFSAMTAPLAGLPGDFSTPDTLMSIRTAGGTAIIENDDGGTDGANGVALSSNATVGSVVRYRATSSGTLYFAVSGFQNTQMGNYLLLISRVVPAFGCPADFNHDGAKAVSDIFAFLSVWFAGCP